MVCKGIVADRLQKINSGSSVLGCRCSRASYGTICKVLYDSSSPAHHRKRTSLDPISSRVYVDNIVDW